MLPGVPKMMPAHYFLLMLEAIKWLSEIVNNRISVSIFRHHCLCLLWSCFWRDFSMDMMPQDPSFRCANYFEHLGVWLNMDQGTLIQLLMLLMLTVMSFVYVTWLINLGLHCRMASPHCMLPVRKATGKLLNYFWRKEPVWTGSQRWEATTLLLGTNEANLVVNQHIVPLQTKQMEIVLMYFFLTVQSQWIFECYHFWRN